MAVDSYTAIRLSEKIYEIKHHRVPLHEQDDLEHSPLTFFVTLDDKNYRNIYPKILKGCTIHQLITQQENRPAFFRYFFNKKIFAKLDVKNQYQILSHSIGLKLVQ